MALPLERIYLGMLGVGTVGKSALTLQFMYDEFVDEYEPTKSDSYLKKVSLRGHDVEVSVLDTAGQESYAGITETAYRTCDGFIIVFSITDIASFYAVNDFMEKIALLRDIGHVPIILVGNKVDLANQRNVSQREAFDYAARKNIEYIETSAKTNHNVQQVFYKMAKAVVDMKHANTQPQIQQNKSRDDGCCCVL